MRRTADEINGAVAQRLIGAIDREDQLGRDLKPLALEKPQLGRRQRGEIGGRNQIRYREFHFAAPTRVIARSAATKQSRRSGAQSARDCFAALAMTVIGDLSSVTAAAYSPSIRKGTGPFGDAAMSPFALEEPASLAEALALLDPDDPSVRAIAGGTALMLMMKSGLYRPQRLVSLRRLAPALTDIRATADGGLEIGAMVRLAELERSAAIRMAVPVIAETLLTHSNVRVRNVATLGGNLAHADPHMDLPPVLIALGASVRVAGPGGERVVRVEDLFTGYLET